MDETNKENSQAQETQNTPAQTPDVGFPIPQPKPKAKMNKWILIIIGLLILGGGGVFLFSRGKGEGETSPTPTSGGFETSTPEPTPTPTPADKSKISIEIQNGTGITGEAAYLQGILKSLGYSDIKVGNAGSTDNANTTITFAKSTSQAVQDEITKKLEDTYKKVDVKTSSTQKTSVLIVTGLRKGATAKPSPTATPKASPSASPSASPTATPTPTP